MNRKLLHLALLFALPSLSFAQYRWDIGGGLGAANYLGEIGGNEQTRRDFVADLKFSQTRLAANIFARHKFSYNFSVKTTMSYGRISGEDRLSTNPGRAGRNLSFRNDLVELSSTAEFCFYSIQDVGRAYRYRNDFKAYVFAGVGGVYSNPKAEYKGEWIALQPLQTEGVKYNKFNLALPAGAGFYFTLNKQHRVGWELGWRTTFTDYLDDISTVYADPKNLSSLASVLANRNGELLPYGNNSDLPDPNNYTAGNKRGDPTHNDSYIFSSINYSYVIMGHSANWKSGSKRGGFHRPKYGPIVYKDKFGFKKRNIRIKQM
jgi:hypothetical protein